MSLDTHCFLLEMLVYSGDRTGYSVRQTEHHVKIYHFYDKRPMILITFSILAHVIVFSVKMIISVHSECKS